MPTVTESPFERLRDLDRELGGVDFRQQAIRLAILDSNVVRHREMEVERISGLATPGATGAPEPALGFEPRPPALQGPCSTD